MSQSKPRYKSIKVREEVYNAIKNYAGRHGMTISSAVLQAVMFLTETERKPRVKENLPLADKVSWYITKTIMSAGAFKAVPSDDNYQRLVKNLEDLHERFNIDTSLQLDIVNKLRGKQQWIVDEKMDFNAVFKVLVLQLLWYLEGSQDAGAGDNK